MTKDIYDYDKKNPDVHQNPRKIFICAHFHLFIHLIIIYRVFYEPCTIS